MLTAKNVSNCSIIMPKRQFCPTSGDGWMVADSLRYVVILLVKSNLFERLILDGMSMC
jgi:hypothetical protein